MKKMNKMIAVMMMMAITITMPAMAGNKSGSHFDKVEKALSHKAVNKFHAYRPDVKTCTFKVSRYDSYKKVMAKAERINGVMDAKWNARTREVTVRYDANKTSARHIRRSVG